METFTFPFYRSSYDTAKDTAGGHTLNRNYIVGCKKRPKCKRNNEFNHLTVAAMFLLTSTAILIAMAIIPTKSKHIAQNGTTAEPIRFEPAEPSAVPPEVEEAAEQFRAEEFTYIQNIYCIGETCEYTESRLEKIELVYTCDAIEGEIFEVYEVDYLYRTPRESTWEPHPGCPSVYLVFSPDANGTRRQVCYFRDVSFSPENNSSFIGVLYESLMDVDETLLWKLNAGTSLDTTLEQTLLAKMCRALPGDGYLLEWKQLALQCGEDGGTAYGLLLYYSCSGSPLIYSDKMERYVPAIFSVLLAARCGLLPEEFRRCLHGNGSLDPLGGAV